MIVKPLQLRYAKVICTKMNFTKFGADAANLEQSPMGDDLGEVTPSYINAYTCAHDQFIRGGIYHVEKIIRYGVFQNKSNCLYFTTHYQ